MSRELLNQLIEKVREIPTRPGNIGGQNYKYVRLEDVIGLLLDVLDSYEAKPLPEPLGYVHHEIFAGFVKEPGDASMSCVKLLIPESGYTVPVYAEPPAREPLTDEQIIDLYFDGFSMGELLEFARAIEKAHGIKE